MEENKIIKPYLCTYKDKEDIKYATDALYVLSGKWRMYVIISIYNGHHRYREIAKNISGITFAMLSRELESMELNKLIIRTEDPDFSKDVRYTLSAYCQSLYPLIESLIDWGKQHRRMIAT